jgi:hypothetical protein
VRPSLWHGGRERHSHIYAANAQALAAIREAFWLSSGMFAFIPIITCITSEGFLPRARSSARVVLISTLLLLLLLY